MIDNSPSDELRELVLPLSSKTEYIHGQWNVGNDAAHNNIAIKKAMATGAKYHVVLTPDIQFFEGTIEQLVNNDALDDSQIIN